MDKAWASGCALIRAASKGQVDEIASLLDDGADINFQRKVSVLRASPQSFAIVVINLCHSDRFLLASRFYAFLLALDSLQMRFYEETALMAASKNDKLEAVKLLLERGADIGVQFTVACVERDVHCAPSSTHEVGVYVGVVDLVICAWLTWLFVCG